MLKSILSKSNTKISQQLTINNQLVDIKAFDLKLKKLTLKGVCAFKDFSLSNVILSNLQILDIGATPITKQIADWLKQQAPTLNHLTIHGKKIIQNKVCNDILFEDIVLSHLEEKSANTAIYHQTPTTHSAVSARIGG